MAFVNFLNEWLVFSLILLAIWLVILIFRKGLRKEMLWTSFFTMLFGFTEPLFVPKYWNPPSLFNLAATTGFDIESFIFAFAVGGIGSVLYEVITKVRHKKIDNKERHSKRHKYHFFALSSTFIIFLFLESLTNLNPIYSAVIAMFIGGMAAMLCRPDLTRKTFIGGVLFLVLYFVFFLSFNLIYPNAVQQFWNLSAISGILVLGVPLEELLFGFTFGLMWSSVYEHFKWYKI